MEVSADEKLTLFFELLQYHDMGAKTNVGYGQFEAREKLKLDATNKEQKCKQLNKNFRKS